MCMLRELRSQLDDGLYYSDDHSTYDDCYCKSDLQFHSPLIPLQLRGFEMHQQRVDWTSRAPRALHAAAYCTDATPTETQQTTEETTVQTTQTLAEQIHGRGYSSTSHRYGHDGGRGHHSEHCFYIVP